MTTSNSVYFYALSARGELLLRGELEQDSGLQIAQVHALLLLRATTDANRERLRW